MSVSIYIRKQLPGSIKITSHDDLYLVGIDFLHTSSTATTNEALTSLHRGVHLQFDEYFFGKRQTFEMPHKFSGTHFQEQCWTSLMSIPFGETWSYSQQANSIGNRKACRAVGGANRKNPLPIIIPCHRIIGKDGSLTGFGGGLKWKEFLLALEQR